MSFLQVLLFVVGLVFGSFFAALSFRLPRKLSVVVGRSFCPRCKKQISWYDNIPVLSFLLLGGKCRFCKKPISWRYSAIELTTAVGFLLIGPNPFYLLLFSILLLIFVVDFEHQIIPDTFVFWGLGFVTFYLLFIIPDSLFPSLLTGFVSSLILLLIHFVTRGRGMGLGDVKFALLGGMIVGIKLWLIWLFLAFLTGGIVGIILILARRAGLKDKIAFGPFLVFSVPVTLIWGERIMRLLWLS